MKLKLTNQYYIISALTIVIFAVLFLVTHLFLANKAELERNKQLAEALNDFTFSTVDKVQEAVERLRTFSSIVVFSDNVSYEEFETYIREYSGKSQNWEIIEWQPIVKSSDRSRFEQHIRQTEFPDFFIWEPDGSGNHIPAQQRDEHVVILYMVTDDRTANTTGLDLSWSDDRMRSKLKARDEGVAQISGFFPIIYSPDKEQKLLGFAITLPVYKEVTVPSRIQDRRRLIKGFMAAVYSIEKLVESEMAKLNKAGLQIAIEATDALNSESSSRSSAFQLNVQLYGNSWTFSITDNPHSFSGQTDSNWKILPFGFLAFGFLILIFIRLQFDSNNKLMNTEGELRSALEKVSQSEQFYANLSRLDPLTGLLNRRSFFETLNIETERASRYEQPLSLMIVDIDNFKQVNDTYGHPSGDSVLVEFADTITRLSRTSDFLCRIGGEEFAFILVNTDASDSLKIAKRLCHVIANHDIEIPSSSDLIRVTVSVGLAKYSETESTENLVGRADKALYKAKESGRNRVSVAPEQK